MKQDAINVYVLQSCIFLFFYMPRSYIISSFWIIACLLSGLFVFSVVSLPLHLIGRFSFGYVKWEKE